MSQIDRDDKLAEQINSIEDADISRPELTILAIISSISGATIGLLVSGNFYTLLMVVFYSFLGGVLGALSYYVFSMDNGNR
jgi:uncharacterized membrane protein YjjP (DUF1212 family)